MNDERYLMNLAQSFRAVPIFMLALLSLLLGGCGYNDFQRLDEQTNCLLYTSDAADE